MECLPTKQPGWASCLRFRDILCEMKKLIGFPQRGSKRHSVSKGEPHQEKTNTLLSDSGGKKDGEVTSFKETDPRTCPGQADLGVCAQCTRVGCAEPRRASPWRKPFCNASNLARSREGAADSCPHSPHPPVPLGAGLIVVTDTLQEGQTPEQQPASPAAPPALLQL